MDLAAATQTPAFERGRALYNAGRYWDAHEAWEDLWRQGRGAAWADLVQGLIQVAAAFHKLAVQAQPGSAARILGRALPRLQRYPSDAGALALGAFVDALHAAREALACGGTSPIAAPALERRADAPRGV